MHIYIYMSIWLYTFMLPLVRLSLRPPRKVPWVLRRSKRKKHKHMKKRKDIYEKTKLNNNNNDNM